MLSTSRLLTQISALVLSIGSEVNASKPRSRPHWMAISNALKATAKIAGKKRLRSRQRIVNEYGMLGSPV